MVLTLNQSQLSQYHLLTSFFMERMPIAWIIYKDTYFVKQKHHTESLCFHDMIHVLQWDKLGVERFFTGLRNWLGAIWI
ncbi:hypothetical protein KKA14_20570 [bacterium]|nr:hypothetical protein [bacterium]